ncbi:MAG: outer membrane protein assembly factor BamD [Myxococcota bacterium]
MFSRLVIAAFALSLASCSAGLLRGPPRDAADAYERAVQNLENGLYPEATQGFAQVKSKYPYSPYAVLADLRAADVQFRRGTFAEAVDAYREFLKLHPRHEDAPYAMLQIGESYFEQIPGDWWILPPPAEKDQASTRRAITAYRDMIARYPQEPLTAKAQTRLAQCRRKLADHELYVAQFYMRHEHYRAAASRAEGLLQEYPGLGLDSAALWVMAESMKTLGDAPAARDALERLVKDFAETPEGKRAAKMLEPTTNLQPRSSSPNAKTAGQG